MSKIREFNDCLFRVFSRSYLSSYSGRKLRLLNIQISPGEVCLHPSLVCFYRDILRLAQYTDNTGSSSTAARKARPRVSNLKER